MDPLDKSQYFPIPDEATMKKFLNQDEHLEERKRNFEGLLFSIVSDEALTARQFSDALVSTIFSREYLRDFRWPTIW